MAPLIDLEQQNDIKSILYTDVKYNTLHQELINYILLSNIM